MGKKIKVVLDTNVFISALLWHGETSNIFKLAEEEEILICISKEIIDEFQKTLTYQKFQSRFALLGKTSDEIINELLEIGKYYSTEQFFVEKIIDDPSDNKFLSCALAADAFFIISGDRHLLNLKKFYDINILSVQEFLQRFEK